MTVFAVFTNQGSHEQVESLFSTREKAEAYAAELDKENRWRRASVAEWEVDGRVSHRYRSVFACRVDEETGTADHWSYERVAGDDEPETAEHWNDTFTGRTIKSPERAEELAREALAKWMTEVQE